MQQPLILSLLLSSLLYTTGVLASGDHSHGDHSHGEHGEHGEHGHHHHHHGPGPGPECGPTDEELEALIKSFGLAVLGKDQESADDTQPTEDHGHINIKALIDELFHPSTTAQPTTTTPRTVTSTQRLPIKSHSLWDVAPVDLIMSNSVLEPVFSVEQRAGRELGRATPAPAPAYLTETAYYAGAGGGGLTPPPAPRSGKALQLSLDSSQLTDKPTIPVVDTRLANFLLVNGGRRRKRPRPGRTSSRARARPGPAHSPASLTFKQSTEPPFLAGLDQEPASPVPPLDSAPRPAPSLLHHSPPPQSQAKPSPRQAPLLPLRSTLPATRPTQLPVRSSAQRQGQPPTTPRARPSATPPARQLERLLDPAMVTPSARRPGRLLAPPPLSTQDQIRHNAVVQAGRGRGRPGRRGGRRPGDRQAKQERRERQQERQERRQGRKRKDPLVEAAAAAGDRMRRLQGETGDCRGRGEGLHADTISGCQRFFMCHEHGRSGRFSCPAGTLFSQELGVCDWARKVQCSNP